MSKYRKLIDWVIGLIVTIFFLYGPSYFFVINPYVNPYKIPVIVLGSFLSYCILSIIYWTTNTNIKLAVHYILIFVVDIVSIISIIVVAAYMG